MAYIEPRLIHLLNATTTTRTDNDAELPPIHTHPYQQTSSSTRLPPLEPNAAGQRCDVLDTNVAQLVSQAMPPLYSIADEAYNTITSLRNDPSGYNSNADGRQLMPQCPAEDLPQHLRLILEDMTGENTEDVSTKKRPVKEDFPQLPHPPKKQKGGTTIMVPPMIVGLHRPPTESIVFPPMASYSYDTHTRPELSHSLKITKPHEDQGIPEDMVVPSPPPDGDRTPTGKVKRRAAKPRRKWSEEETNHLLLGVSKYGVGRWTDILEDPSYRFNERTAGDLKDRFRTCCPAELRGSPSVKGDGAEETTAPANGKREKGRRPKKGIVFRPENILNDSEEDYEPASEHNDSESAPKQRKSRAHRKKLEDLAELGISGPFKKSQRRERRPFSEQDDREILEGFELYGPHWTKIQRDTRFHLATRQPTDLRDRLRNKYPEKMMNTEKTTMQVRDPGGLCNNVLEPSVNMSIENSLNASKTSILESQLNRTGSREEIPKWPSQSTSMELGEHPQIPPLYWGEGNGAGLVPGEMDISRLLLYDTQVSNEPNSTDRRGYG